MANSILNAGDDGSQALVIAREALMQLENNCVMGNLVHRDYEPMWGGAIPQKIGDTFTIRRPVKFTSNDGPARVHQDVTEGNITMKVNIDKHVSWGFDLRTLKLSIEEYSDRYIKPAMIELANQIDLSLHGLYKDVWNWVGPADGTKIDSFADFAYAPERLDEQAVPKGERRTLFSPRDHWGVVGAQTSLFFDSVGVGAFREASLGRIGGTDSFSSQNVRNHTVGAHDTAALNSGTLSVDYDDVKDSYEQTLTAQNFDNSTEVLKQGDVITLDSVYAVNPVSKEKLSYLQQFVVKEDVTSTGAGAASIKVSPPIITSGPYQTVNAAPASSATINFHGTASTAYRQNLSFHKNAFGLAMIPLPKPQSVAFAATASRKGYAASVYRDFDINTREEVIRVDILAATKALYPDLATRFTAEIQSA